MKNWRQYLGALLLGVLGVCQSVMAAPTAGQFFAWVEGAYSGYFPPVVTERNLVVGGVSYVVHVYGNGNVLGVTSPEGLVQGIGPFTDGVLLTFGHLADFTCSVTPSVCGIVGSNPGTYAVAVDSHALLPNYVNGKVTWLGAKDGTSYAVAPSDIAFVRWNSNRSGWGKDAQTSTPPAADGTLRVNKTCNNDRGLPTIITKDGKELWPDFSAQGYKLSGDVGAKVASGGLIEYGKSGFQSARVSLTREADNTATVVVDFAANCLFGFGKDDALIPLDWAQPLMFVWHSNKAGSGRSAGWGFGTVAPSIKTAWLKYDEVAGKFAVSFTDMACADQGGITVYRAKSVSADGKTVVYDPTADGFGAGWLVVPKKGDTNPIWQAEDGIVWDSDKFQITYDLPLCTQK
ncbi:MAG: hypothetical protein WA082_03150 [Candidatus Moraniibacteriota bacterium]